MPTRFLCLIPDDFPTEAAAIRRAARKLGPALLAQTVAEGRALLQYHDDIDVVLSAETLDDGSWRDVLRQISQNDSPAELIVLARGGGGALSMTAKAHGVFGVLGQPLNLNVLTTMAHQAIQRARSACHEQAAAGD